MFTKKERFVHSANPSNLPELTHVTKELNSNENYIYALILYRSEYTTFDQAYSRVADYTVFDNEDERDRQFEDYIENSVESSIEDELVNGINSWLYHYIDIDNIVADSTSDRTYAEVLSTYEEEIEYTLNGTTYYLYKN